MIDQKKFVAAALNPGKKAFIIHVAYLEAIILIYLACKAQIALLVTKKVTIPTEYLVCKCFFKKTSCRVFQAL